MDLESSLFQRLKQKNGLSSSTLPLRTSEDKSRMTDNRSDSYISESEDALIPPTPSPVFAKFVGTKKRLREPATLEFDNDDSAYRHSAEDRKSDTRENSQNEQKRKNDFTCSSFAAMKTSPKSFQQTIKTKKKIHSDYKYDDNNRKLEQVKSLNTEHPNEAVSSGSRISALERLKKMSKNQYKNVTESERELSFSDRRSNINKVHAGEKRKVFSQEASHEAKHCKVDSENSRKKRMNEISVIRGDASLSRNHLNSDLRGKCIADSKNSEIDSKFSSTASALQKLRALRKKRFALKYETVDKSSETSTDPEQNKNNNNKQECLAQTASNLNGFHSTKAVLGGWPSDSDSDSSDIILLSDIIKPSSQNNSQQVLNPNQQVISPIHGSHEISSPILSSRRDSLNTTENAMLHKSRHTSPSSFNATNISLFPGVLKSPVSKKLFSSPPQTNKMNGYVARGTVSPQTPRSKVECKSPIGDYNLARSPVSIRSPHSTSPGKVGLKLQLSPQLNHRETVIDYLKQKYQTKTPNCGLPETQRKSEDLGKACWSRNLSRESYVETKGSMLPRCPKRGINRGIRSESDQSTESDESSDCQILGMSAHSQSRPQMPQKRSFHSKVLGLGRPSRNRGAPKITPVMGNGWTRATEMLTNQIQHADRVTVPRKPSPPSSTAQKVHTDGTPQTCQKEGQITPHIHGHLTGLITPNTHDKFMHNTPNTLDNSVIKMVKQMENDEDYARKLQEEMDMEFAMALQNEAATPNHVDANTEITSNVRDQPGRLLGTSRRRSRTTRQAVSQSDDTDEEIHGYFGPSPRRRSNRRDSIAEVEQLLYQLTGRTRAGATGRRGRRRGQGMTTSTSNPRDSYEFLLNVADIIGDVKQKGLSKSESNRLPVRTFTTSDNQSEGQKTECLICMCDYEHGDSLKILTCFHEFHSLCIDKWIEGNATCPVCRVDVKLH